MAKFFDFMLELFGEEKLVKKITLDDLSEEDLDSGGFLHNIGRDRAGRSVWFYTTKYANYDKAQNIVR